MKTLLLSTDDIQGGAARAAYRLHQGLQKAGVSSQMLVKEKSSQDPTVIAPATKLAEGIAKTKQTFAAFPLKLYSQRQSTTFSTQWLPDNILPQVAQIAPDIINLHWINNSYMQIETLGKLKQPLVWSLHDMWAFTGGCHYNQNCHGYTNSCGSCPQLGSNQDWDLSRWIWRRKVKAWRNINLTIVALTSWLASCAASSSLFKQQRIEIIPNGIDTNIYRPISRQLAREVLNLPQDKELLLFGSLNATSDKRKGFHLLQAALQDLRNSSPWQDRLELVVFGASEPENPPDLGFKTHYLGTFADDLSLALIYSAADVFVLPSVQDNLPNTIMEAIACGIPCLGFEIGGLPDMIEHHGNGYLAQPFNIEDLAQGITWLLENHDRHQKLSRRAREKAEQEFTLELQAQRYLKLFRELREEEQ